MAGGNSACLTPRFRGCSARPHCFLILPEFRNHHCHRFVFQTEKPPIHIGNFVQRREFITRAGMYLPEHDLRLGYINRMGEANALAFILRV